MREVTLLAAAGDRGDLLVLAPTVTHSVTARRDARFLLTLALER